MKLGNFEVKWQHDREKGFTYVSILGDDHPLPRSESFAAKSPSDNYDKAIGRKVSLKRALDKVETKTLDLGWCVFTLEKPLFTKEERTAIWKDYRDHFEKPSLSLPEALKQLAAEKAKNKVLSDKIEIILKAAAKSE